MKVFKTAAVLWMIPLVVVGVVVNCTGNMNNPGGDPGNYPTEEYPVACDPDGMAPCPDDYFICTEDEAGNKHCEGQNPAVPDGGDWDCEVVGDRLICHGDEMPDDAGGWECEEVGDEVICERDEYYPGDGGDGTWDCYYDGEFIICEDGDFGFPDDEDDDNDDGETDVPDDDRDRDEPDDGDERIDDCLCIPGAWRYCDTPLYCDWGKQFCNDDGMGWGECTEVASPVICSIFSEAYTAAAEACCIARGFCCQDFWDLDLDGNTNESLGNCGDVMCR